RNLLAGNPGKKVSVVCVWRATVATEPAVRVLEARMLARTDVIALGRQEHDDQAKGEGTMRSFAARQRKRTLPRWGARQD
ncbi:hypothetical protein FPK54_28425, partial [Acinetobacter baumannii]|nr:hypothetical protein [Acinetobacter baumannii]